MSKSTAVPPKSTPRHRSPPSHFATSRGSLIRTSRWEKKIGGRVDSLRTIGQLHSTLAVLGISTLQ